MGPTTEEWLLGRRKEILRLLVDEADRSQRARLVGELEKKQSDLDLIQKFPPGKLARCRRPIDAVVAFLEEQNRALEEDEIIDGVIAGGFGGGTADQKNPIHWSIRVFIKGTGKRKKVLRTLDNLVGLYKWDDSKFKAS